jgi:hypothetical protein
MSAKIIVGYKTQPVSNIEELMPDFKAPANFRDQEKITQDVNAKKQAFLKTGKDAPYTGTFAEVFLLDNRPRKLLQFLPVDGKPSIAVRVRNYLLKTYPDGWSDREYDPRNPPFRLIGFGTRRFLKMLGLELSLPSVARPLPLRMWYSNSEHRDIGEAVLPHDFDKTLTLETVLKRRRPSEPAAAAKWDKSMNGWPGPHHVPEKDVWLAVELAAQIGLLE